MLRAFGRRQGRRTFAALGARLPQTRVQASSPRRQIVSRIPFALAGKFRRLRFRFDNWKFSSSNGGGLSACPTALTIVKAAIELNGVVVPLSFAGDRSVTLASGAIAIWSDWVKPSALGLSRFQTALYGKTDHGYRVYQGLLGFFRGSATVPDFTGEFPLSNVAVNANNTGLCALYAPSNHIDQIDATGAMSTPTGAQTTMDFDVAGYGLVTNTYGWGPTEIIGETLDGRQLTIVARGGSSYTGRDDDRYPTDMVVGYGRIDRTSQAEDNSLSYVIPTGHVTKSGGEIAPMFANPGTAYSYKFANHLTDYTGGNGIESGRTPAQESATITSLANAARSSGVQYVIEAMATPVNTTTDNFTTFDGLDYTSFSGVNAQADELKNRQSRPPPDKRLDLVLVVPAVRAPTQNRKWLTDEVTPYLSTSDGKHGSHRTALKQSEEDRWAYWHGLAMPHVSRNYAAGCIIKPASGTLAKVEAFIAGSLDAGIAWHALWWLNAPTLAANDNGYQTRRVGLIKSGFWDLFQGGGTITYAADGTKGDGVAGYFNTYIIPASNFGNSLSPVLINNITIAAKVVDEPDRNAILGTPTSTAEQQTINFNPRTDSGNFSFRLNDNTGYARAVPSGIGTFIGTRTPSTTREGFYNGVSLGIDTAVGPTALSPISIRLFRSYDPTLFSSRKTPFIGIAGANTKNLTPAQQAAVMTTLIDALAA